MFGEMRMKEGEFRCGCGWKETEESKPIWPEGSRPNGARNKFAWICPDCNQIYCSDYALSEREHDIVDEILKKIEKEKLGEINEAAWEFDEKDGCRRLFREAVREEKKLEGDTLNFEQEIKYLRSKGWTWSKIQKVCTPVKHGAFVTGL